MNIKNHFLRQTLKQLKEELCEQLCQHGNITHVVHKLVNHIDKILIILFHKHDLDHEGQFCLLALGSYGRRELQLHSDIDLLLLHDENIDSTALSHAQLFIQDCWDIGLEVSHQITTVNDCIDLASQDLSVISSLIDMHLICGRGALMEELQYQIHPLHMWASHDYFFAKINEQHKRYEKYGETAYNLEPNIKYGPGGLRDLQILLHVGKRHFGFKRLSDGIAFGFITDKEYDELMHCQHFLWRVRFLLHMLTQKNEERLLFDYQVKLAKLLGYEDNEHSLGIEQFMKNYFKVIQRCRELNEMLLQWFSEAIIYSQKQKLIPLDHWFQLSNSYIEVRRDTVFKENPQCLLKIFLWIALDPEIEGVRASTIRLIRQHLYLINESFLLSQEARHTFINIFEAADNPFRVLQRMSRYGVLAHYLACFGAVTGQMQYDLFHVYTVEQHTLFVIRNIARFKHERYAKQFPLCYQLMPKIRKPSILYLAALFHDIAKGRGGDHSELGAIEAKAFAERHELDEKDQLLLVWLVKNHLLMSQTAQRQDIYDPQTISKFCHLLPEKEYLDYLYLLTVADICGTNPALWNTWKDSLLKELYVATAQAMQQERALLDAPTIIDIRRQEALKILMNEGIATNLVQELWKSFKGKYFLHESPEIIARHTKAILNCHEFPLVLIMPHHTQAGTEVFIYMPHRDDRFTITTTILSNHHVNIQEANILTNENHFDMDTYVILDENNQVFFDEPRNQAIGQALVQHLTDPQLPSISLRRLSRTQAHFNLKPTVTFTEESQKPYTCLFLVADDRWGLLASIGRIFLKEHIYLHHAKIATAGERAEDMFFISNQNGNKLNNDEKKRLRKAIVQALQ